MDYSEKWGVDVEEAVKLALVDLKLSRDEVEVTVLEEPSKGFFGIGSKLAKVRVEKKKPAVEEKPANLKRKKSRNIRNPKRRKTRFRAAWRRKLERKTSLVTKVIEIRRKNITEIEKRKKSSLHRILISIQ